MNRTDRKERIMRIVFQLTACVSILAVIMICFFLFYSGVPVIFKIGPMKFFFGKVWKPNQDIYGIFPMIMGSIAVTALAALIGVPTGILTAAFLAEFCPKRIYSFLKSALELLAGIPSVVYGFFGLMVIVPGVRRLFGGSGSSWLSAGIVLGIMILPTIVSVSESSLRAVPRTYYEGSLALGATHEHTVFSVMLPAARSGVMAGVVLGIGRAIGETMAVIMVEGNQAIMPRGLLKGLRTMTGNIVLEMGYATDLHRGALIATGVVLFLFILVINLGFQLLKRKMNHE